MARVFLLGWVTVAIACTSDGQVGSGESGDAGACTEISDACHDKDAGPGSGLPHECHELAHAGDVAMCTAMKDACIQACNDAPLPGTGEAGSATESGGQEGSGGSTGPGGSSESGPVSATEGTSGDTGQIDTSSEAGSTGGSGACADHCACMTVTCSAYPDYPYRSEQACNDACDGFSTDELACWSMWCTEAVGGGGAQEHLCEHAWGAFGLGEC
jgi:hypothetical protein